MNVTSMSVRGKRIGIVAKHPFYFEDIRSQLEDLDIQLIYATDILQIREHILEGVTFDFVFFPHYSKLVPPDFLEQNNCIGFHTGDLPRDRGGSPIQNKILRGEYQTSVSAIKLIEELDAGDILCREDISLEFGTIEEILREISVIIARLIKKIMTGNPISTPQTGDPSVSSRLSSQASELKFDELSLKQIYDRIRMLDGLEYPPAYIQFTRYKIFLSNAKIQNNELTFVSRVEESK